LIYTTQKFGGIKNGINKYKSGSFWESFTWKFAESALDNLDSIADFTSIIKTSSTNNITREVGITWA
jgi:hypothetical protein